MCASAWCVCDKNNKIKSFAILFVVVVVVVVVVVIILLCFVCVDLNKREKVSVESEREVNHDLNHDNPRFSLIKDFFSCLMMIFDKSKKKMKKINKIKLKSEKYNKESTFFFF